VLYFCKTLDKPPDYNGIIGATVVKKQHHLVADHYKIYNNLHKIKPAIAGFIKRPIKWVLN
jgi:hypothetical protein